MATILPPSYTQTVYEGDSVNFQIAYQLTASDTFVSYQITSSVDLSGTGVAIAGDRISGVYNDVFERLGVPLWLSYRRRSDGSVQRVNGFSNLPAPTTCDLVKFEPPSTLSQDIVYTATLVYDESVTTGGNPDTGAGGTTTIVRKTISLPVTQTVKGTYERWGARMRQFIAESGPFPSIE